jgi:tetratricopeptide (TPR) repeat protein
MDSLHAEVGPAHPNLFMLGMQAANRTRDPAAIARWTDRYLRGWPGDSASVFAGHARYPELRAAALDRLRRMVAAAEAPDDALRPLGMSRETYAATLHRHRRSRLVAELGTALERAGDRAAAADLLQRAAELVWRPELLQRAASARLALGDTTAALRLLAQVAVDPGTTDSLHRAIATLVAGRVPPATWEAWRRDAAGTMRERVLAESQLRRLPTIRLRSDAGREVTLAELLGGRPAIVAVWSAGCGPSIEDLRELARFRRAMEARGVPVITVAERPLDARGRALLARQGITFPTYEDHRGELGRGFANFSTPNYYVLDREGRIRFERSLRTDIPRQLQALEKGGHES